MAVPKSKVTSMKAGHRRSGHRKEVVTTVVDGKSGNPRRPHHIDLKDGTYRNREVIAVKSDDGGEDDS